MQADGAERRSHQPRDQAGGARNKQRSGTGRKRRARDANGAAPSSASANTAAAAVASVAPSGGRVRRGITGSLKGTVAIWALVGVLVLGLLVYFVRRLSNVERTVTRTVREVRHQIKPDDLQTAFGMWVAANPQTLVTTCAPHIDRSIAVATAAMRVHMGTPPSAPPTPFLPRPPMGPVPVHAPRTAQSPLAGAHPRGDNDNNNKGTAAEAGAGSRQGAPLLIHPLAPAHPATGHAVRPLTGGDTATVGTAGLQGGPATTVPHRSLPAYTLPQAANANMAPPAPTHGQRVVQPQQNHTSAVAPLQRQQQQQQVPAAHPPRIHQQTVGPQPHAPARASGDVSSAQRVDAAPAADQRPTPFMRSLAAHAPGSHPEPRLSPNGAHRSEPSRRTIVECHGDVCVVRDVQEGETVVPPHVGNNQYRQYGTDRTPRAPSTPSFHGNNNDNNNNNSRNNNSDGDDDDDGALLDAHIRSSTRTYPANRVTSPKGAGSHQGNTQAHPTRSSPSARSPRHSSPSGALGQERPRSRTPTNPGMTFPNVHQADGGQTDPSQQNSDADHAMSGPDAEQHDSDRDRSAHADPWAMADDAFRARSETDLSRFNGSDGSEGEESDLDHQESNAYDRRERAEMTPGKHSDNGGWAREGAYGGHDAPLAGQRMQFGPHYGDGDDGNDSDDDDRIHIMTMGSTDGHTMGFLPCPPPETMLGLAFHGLALERMNGGEGADLAGGGGGARQGHGMPPFVRIAAALPPLFGADPFALAHGLFGGAAAPFLQMANGAIVTDTESDAEDGFPRARITQLSESDTDQDCDNNDGVGDEYGQPTLITDDPASLSSFDSKQRCDEGADAVSEQDALDSVPEREPQGDSSTEPDHDDVEEEEEDGRWTEMAPTGTDNGDDVKGVTPLDEPARHEPTDGAERKEDGERAVDTKEAKEDGPKSEDGKQASREDGDAGDLESTSTTEGDNDEGFDVIQLDRATDPLP